MRASTFWQPVVDERSRSCGCDSKPWAALFRIKQVRDANHLDAQRYEPG